MDGEATESQRGKESDGAFRGADPVPAPRPPMATGPAAAEWVAVAAASGVVGNLAYDTLKAGLFALWPGVRRKRRRIRELARISVEQRLAGVRLPAGTPPPQRLHEIAMVKRDGMVQVYLELPWCGQVSIFVVTVPDVPLSSIGGDQVQIRQYNAVDPFG